MNKLSKIQVLSLSLLILIAVFTAYYNHFNNAFHFDDSHTIENNVFIRNIENIPDFFKDARTFSSLPSNQSYRPIISLSLALDYWLGNGLDPFYFHLSTFIWFLVQLVLMYFFYIKLFTGLNNHSAHTGLALFAVAWYGLHPVSAETVNYIIQRGDLYSTLSVVAAFVVYIYAPRKRKFGFYLLPIIVGSLAKPPAIMFAPLLFLYILLFEEKSSLLFWNSKFEWTKSCRAIKASLVTFITCFLLYFLQAKMTSATYTPGGTSLYNYIITQPLVHLEYLRSFFIPSGLCADTDWVALKEITFLKVILPLAAIAGLVSTILFCSRSEMLRPISFGLLWFFISQLPTTVTPLSEVMNTHRMYFPFVGLMLSTCWIFKLLLNSLKFSKSLLAVFFGRTLQLAALCSLIVYGYATTLRNEVWRSEESLWADNSIAAPKNGRGLMNYGLTLMSRGDYIKAKEYFYKALELTPQYSNLHINIAIVEGELKNSREAEKYFLSAINLAPQSASPYFFYARWLHNQGRNTESILNLKKSIQNVPEYFESRHLLIKILAESKEWAQSKSAAMDALNFNSNDSDTKNILLSIESQELLELEAKKEILKNSQTAENLLEISFTYYRSAKYEECIKVAREALLLKPHYAEAYNNIGSAFSALGQWDLAIENLENALSINPDFELAKNNLAWAKSRK